MASLLQKQVYQAYLNEGLSPNQARIITAEIGREGSFSPKNLFGVHIDPKNGATNLGMLSWQGNRGQALYSFLKAQGLIRGNGIAPTQEALNAMARFSINEMRNKKEYRQTAQTFLNNPDVDYQTGAAVLGRNFIRWRYDDPVYKSGHVNRDKFYQAMGGVVGQKQLPTIQRTPMMGNWAEFTKNNQPQERTPFEAGNWSQFTAQNPSNEQVQQRTPMMGNWAEFTQSREG
ncbi:phage tail tip lysozyme [Acinetobacter bereziniae]|uniref:phage tail tip lysozyme n=1 Tax=Acinetobacter bereziniae TaxID=106648 RepID=UPI003AF47491